MGFYSSYIKDIPENKLVKIGCVEDVDFILDNEFSFNVSSSYNAPIPSGGNDLLTILSEFNDKIPSGQFTIQGAQIWKTTEPLDVSLSLNLYMKNDGYNDVIRPIKILQQQTVPRKKPNSSIGMLIPPGPSITEILKESGSVGTTVAKKLEGLTDNGSGGVTNITVGKYKFRGVMLKKVDPTFSETMDENGYPTSASLTVDFTSIVIPTTDYIENVYGRI